MQLTLFPQSEPRVERKAVLPDSCPQSGISRVAAPRWVFGRINKKKGRHVRLLKGHPGAGIVCIAYSTVDMSKLNLY